MCGGMCPGSMDIIAAAWLYERGGCLGILMAFLGIARFLCDFISGFRVCWVIVVLHGVGFLAVLRERGDSVCSRC